MSTTKHMPMKITGPTFLPSIGSAVMGPEAVAMERGRACEVCETQTTCMHVVWDLWGLLAERGWLPAEIVTVSTDARLNGFDWVRAEFGDDVRDEVHEWWMHNGEKVWRKWMKSRDLTTLGGLQVAYTPSK